MTIIMLDPKYFAIHCSATPPTMDIGDKEIKEWHLEKGWSDIGYHVIIRRDGRIEYGRAFDVLGAHVKGFNSVSLGVCLIGGVDGEGTPRNNYTVRQYHTLERVLNALHLLFPDAVVRGHRDFPGVDKACPSFDVQRWCRNKWIKFG